MPEYKEKCEKNKADGEMEERGNADNTVHDDVLKGNIENAVGGNEVGEYVVGGSVVGGNDVGENDVGENDVGENDVGENDVGGNVIGGNVVCANAEGWNADVGNAESDVVLVNFAAIDRENAERRNAINEQLNNDEERYGLCDYILANWFLCGVAEDTKSFYGICAVLITILVAIIVISDVCSNAHDSYRNIICKHYSI
ncbi:unnamed protein product [Clavelina lepadiformis]|uniref:Uncharacterized protein n=1 Tax=Clavelina lepadiformis TaxID=159417 RepID=A0ABP0GWY2_CLALP